MIFKFGNRFRRASALISKIVGTLIAVFTLLAFFSVKPMPMVNLALQYGADESPCALQNDQGRDYSDIIPLRGQVVYVRVHLNIELETDRCGIWASGEAPDWLWGEIENDTAILVTTDFILEGEDTAYILDLLLPKKSTDFIQVNLCEGSCYSFEGPVRLQEAFYSEAVMGVKFIPINVYSNSHLTSSYECRLKVLDSSFSLIAPIYCAIF